MRALMRDLARGAFTYAPPTLDLLDRAMDIDRRYADLGLGLVDASVVALAEEVGVYRLATRDLRHFGAVTLSGGRGFELVGPSSPSRASREVMLRRPRSPTSARRRDKASPHRSIATSDKT
jgi:hypothetical protein